MKSCPSMIPTEACSFHKSSKTPNKHLTENSVYDRDHLEPPPEYPKNKLAMKEVPKFHILKTLSTLLCLLKMICTHFLDWRCSKERVQVERIMLQPEINQFLRNFGGSWSAPLSLCSVPALPHPQPPPSLKEGTERSLTQNHGSKLSSIKSMISGYQLKYILLHFRRQICVIPSTLHKPSLLPLLAQSLILPVLLLIFYCTTQRGFWFYHSRGRYWHLERSSSALHLILKAASIKLRPALLFVRFLTVSVLSKSQLGARSVPTERKGIGCTLWGLQEQIRDSWTLFLPEGEIQVRKASWEN